MSRALALLWLLALAPAGCAYLPMAIVMALHPDLDLTKKESEWGEVKRDGIYRLKQDVFLDQGYRLDPYNWPPPESSQDRLRMDDYQASPESSSEVEVLKAGTCIRMTRLGLLRRDWGKAIEVSGVVIDGSHAGRPVGVDFLCEIDQGAEEPKLKRVKGEYLQAEEGLEGD
jgi:hypothetical protein